MKVGVAVKVGVAMCSVTVITLIDLGLISSSMSTASFALSLISCCHHLFHFTSYTVPCRIVVEQRIRRSLIAPSDECTHVRLRQKNCDHAVFCFPRHISSVLPIVINGDNYGDSNLW